MLLYLIFQLILDSLGHIFATQKLTYFVVFVALVEQIAIFCPCEEQALRGHHVVA